MIRRDEQVQTSVRRYAVSPAPTVVQVMLLGHYCAPFGSDLGGLQFATIRRFGDQEIKIEAFGWGHNIRAQNSNTQVPVDWWRLLGLGSVWLSACWDICYERASVNR